MVRQTIQARRFDLPMPALLSENPIRRHVESRKLDFAVGAGKTTSKFIRRSSCESSGLNYDTKAPYLHRAVQRADQSRS
jgi:hypothetical protein